MIIRAYKVNNFKWNRFEILNDNFLEKNLLIDEYSHIEAIYSFSDDIRTFIFDTETIETMPETGDLNYTYSLIKNDVKNFIRLNKMKRILE